MEPIIRCYYCNVPQKQVDVYAEGCCTRCGSRKMREAGRLTDDEMATLIASGFDPEANGWQHEAVG